MEEQVLDNQQDNSNQGSQVDEGGAAASLPAVQPVIEAGAEQPKTALDKLKEKSLQGVAPGMQPAVPAVIENAFKANFKFKAAGRELEVPKMLQGVIKDAESEKYLHTLLSKAHGIEMIQDKLKATREDRAQLFSAYNQVMGPVRLGQEAYARGDLDTVFDAMKIDRNKVLQWAYRQVELSQMSPDQRQVHERASQAEKRTWELERQSRFQAQQGQTQQAEQINQMLDLVMERTDVSAIAQAYDEKMQKLGKTQTFRDLTVMMGEQAFAQGKMISPMEAAKRAAELLGESFGGKQAAASLAAGASATTEPQAQPAAQPAKTKIVLPNAGGSKTASPAKGKVKSIDEIRALHQKMASQ